MLHPVLIVTLYNMSGLEQVDIGKIIHLGVILTCMCAARLFASKSSCNGLNGTLLDVTELQSLDEVTVVDCGENPMQISMTNRCNVRVPDQTPILGANLVEVLVYF